MTVFYVSLFLASLVVAALVVWFYRVVVQASRETYKSFLPSSNEEVSMASMARVTASRRASKGRGTPWGWKNTVSGVPAVSRAVAMAAQIFWTLWA